MHTLMVRRNRFWRVRQPKGVSAHGQSGRNIAFVSLTLAALFFGEGKVHAALGFGLPAALNGNAASDSWSDGWPQVTTDGAGNWVAVWVSAFSDTDIHVSRSTNNGTTWTAPLVLNTNAAFDEGDDLFPQVTTDGLGNWVAVWSSNNTPGGTAGLTYRILVSRSTNNGATWTDPISLNPNAASDEFDPQVTSDGAGNWVAVWWSLGPDGTHHIFTSRATDNGAMWTSPAILNTHTPLDFGGNYWPQVTTDGAGNWIAVWQAGDTVGGTMGGEGDALVSLSTNNGLTWTDPIALNANAASDSQTEGDPQVTTDGAGNWVAVWHGDDTLEGTIGADFDVLVSVSNTVGGGPSFTVTNPNGGELWYKRTQREITWTSVGAVAANVSVTLGGGPLGLAISNLTPNDGSYLWNVPPNIATSSNYYIEIAGNDGSGPISDRSDGVFSIQLLPIVTNVTALNVPEGGGANFQVKLAAQPVNNVTVNVARNSGDTDITVSSGASRVFTPANWNSFQMVGLSAAEDADTTHGAANIRCSGSGLAAAIVGATELDNDDTATLTVTTPNGGEVWPKNTLRTFTWNSSGNLGSDVSIKLRRIAQGVTKVVTASTPNDGSFTWLVGGLTNANNWIAEIASVSNPAIVDQSNAVFRITAAVSASITVTNPNGGEVWPKFSTQTFTWNSSGAVGAEVSIRLRRVAQGTTKVVTASTPNDGSFSWTVAGLTAATNWIAEIASVSTPAIVDQSNAVFKITP